MKTLVYFLVAALFSVPSLVSAQEHQVILPESFGSWKGFHNAGGWTVGPLDAVTKEAGETLREGRAYARGDKTLTVVVQQFRDPSGAYQVYTATLSTKLNPSTVAPLTAVGNDQLTALLGNRVVNVSPVRGISDADLKLLLEKLKRPTDQSPLPPIRAYLPDVDLIQGSQKYALGPVAFDTALQSLKQGKFNVITPEIGFTKGAEAMLASYHSATGKAETLILVQYPTPQIAEQQLRHIQPLLATNPELSGASVERNNSLLSLVLSPVSAQSAASLRENIKYGISVTWNEGSHTLTDPPWVSVLKNIFLGTFAFCGLAIVLGLAFGGIRVLTKRVLPGKVFDRPEDMEVLQLGLSGKRIDPRDFY